MYNVWKSKNFLLTIYNMYWLSIYMYMCVTVCSCLYRLINVPAKQ